MTLKVIGTDFDRTGTDSMREALDMLGFDPCHHMSEVNSSETQKRLWRAFVQGTPTGWEPLCAHLGVAVPSQPYPSRNTASDFQNTMLKPFAV